MAAFDPYCMELSGVLTNKPKGSHPAVVKEGEVNTLRHDEILNVTRN